MNPQITLAMAPAESLSYLGVDDDSADLLHPSPAMVEAAAELRRTIVAGEIVGAAGGMTREEFAEVLRTAIGMI